MSNVSKKKKHLLQIILNASMTKLPTVNKPNFFYKS